MMYKEFYVHKKSGTYAETLEAYGIANLINEILQRSGISGRKITIEDQGLYYLLTSNHEITDEIVNVLPYFQIIKFLVKDRNTKLPDGIAKTDCFDYPGQKAEQDWYKAEFERINKNKESTKEQKQKAKQELSKQKLSEFGKKIDAEYDVYKELIKNPYISFVKLYENLYRNQSHFSEILKDILDHYAQLPKQKRNFVLIDDSPTSQQLFNPNQGKGLNKSKATNASMSNLKGKWIAETMKISGGLKMMSVQYVKVGTGYDLKIYVPEFKQIQFSESLKLITEFKRYLKSISPVKLDILNILSLIVHFIKLTPEYKKGKVKNTIQGFHSVYQKDLGQNKAVANISFINTPDFIAYSTREEGKDWIDILEEQKSIVSSIEETGESIQGLQNYRQFLGSSGSNALIYFNNFSYWYSAYLMQALSDNKRYVKAFKIETLNKFYDNMETKELNLSEIIHNEGFKAIATAIRNSTIFPQIFGDEVFKPKYGLAQKLQNKSKSKADLVSFIGEFITIYNAETARKREIANADPQKKNNKRYYRKLVTENELDQLYNILDNRPSRLVGALLASYGFALNKKEAPIEDTQISEEQ